MTAPKEPRFDVTELDKAAAHRVEEGQYPSDLAADLHQHFERVRSTQDVKPSALTLLLQRVESASQFGPERIPYVSSVPMGATGHRLIGRVVSRQTTGILIQVREFALAVRDFLAALVEQLPEEQTLRESSARLNARVDALLDQLSRGVRDTRGPGSSAPASEETSFHPGFSQDAFMSRFRGSRETILSRYADLADRFAGLGPVLDVGCGRGEMLELLRERGIDAVGIDLDPDLVGTSRSLGFKVELADALAYLAETPDESLGGVFVGQLVEHLDPSRTVELVLAAHRALRPGGRLVVETINPASLWAVSHAYYLDPTHVRPVRADYLEFVCRELGFAGAEIELRAPVPDSQRLEPVPRSLGLPDAAREVLNSNIDKLNDLLYGPQDYALIATR